MQQFCRIFLFLLRGLHLDQYLSDELYLKLLYQKMFGKKLNLENPQTFNEKLQWLKLYDRRPEYTTMVDKYAVKKYVADIIGDEYVIPTYGVWDSPDDIEWDLLPEQFVLKCTHDSGGQVICRDKSRLDKAQAISRLKKSLKTDYYKAGREWPYENVPRRVIAERYMEDPSNINDLPDYKFFCFDGEVKALFIGTERGTGDVKFDYYDADFNHLDLIQIHPMSGKNLPRPLNFEIMRALASKLSKGIPQVRVDFYNINGNIYFGELTFFHHGGIIPFHPEKWDYIFGSWIKLPQRHTN